MHNVATTNNAVLKQNTNNSRSNIQKISHKGKHVATIIRKNFTNEGRNNGIEFFSQDEDFLQVGMISKKAGDIAKPHVHVCTPLTITEIHEVIFVESGKVKFAMYDSVSEVEFASVVLEGGDKIIHMGEGHGLEYLEDSVIFEVKQGPYHQDMNYKRFLRK